MRKFTAGTATVLVLGYALLASMPAFGQDAGTVNTTISVPPAPAPCITGVPASIPYGTAPFSKPGTPSSLDALPIIKGLKMQNCSVAAENILAKGTDATILGSPAWQLSTLPPLSGNPCDNGLNKFVHRLQVFPGPTSMIDLQTTNQVLLSGASSGSLPVLDSILYLPCVGSVGAGSTASADIVFTAVIP